MRLNLLDIHNMILKNINIETKKHTFVKKKNHLEKINENYGNKDIKMAIKYYENKINLTKNDKLKLIYLSKSLITIEKYKNFLKKPISISFMKPNKINNKDNKKELIKIYKEFFSAIKKF